MTGKLLFSALMVSVLTLSGFGQGYLERNPKKAIQDPHPGNWIKGADGLWECKVPGEFNFRQLYVDSKKAVRARVPNEGSFYRVLYYDYPERSAHVDNKHVKQWEQLEQVEMVAQAGWTVSYLRLARIERNNAVKPDGIGNWQTRFQLTFMYPTKSMKAKMKAAGAI